MRWRAFSVQGKELGWIILKSNKYQVQRLECLSVDLLPKSSRPSSTQTSLRNSGSQKAVGDSKPASRFNGIGKCTIFRPRSLRKSSNRTNESSSNGPDTAVLVPWNGPSNLKRMAQLLSA